MGRGGGLTVATLSRRTGGSLPRLVFNDIGAPVNHGETVDDGVGTEFQGATIHGTEHWLGCSVARRAVSTASTFNLLSAWAAAPLSVERINGKLGYDSSFRACTRAVMQDVHPWTHAHRSTRRVRQPIPASVWGELAMTAILAPLKQVDLRAPYCNRLECVDAAPGGHGRAWAAFDSKVVHELCRVSDGPGAPTSLYTDYGI